MNRLLSQAIAAVLLFTSSLSCLADGTLLHETVFSNTLEQNRSVNIYLPEGYDSEDSSIRYPVVYFLHGGYVTQNSYPMLIDALDDLIGTGDGPTPEENISPMIAVMPNGNSSWYGGLTWWTNSPLHGMIEDYVLNDIIAYVDSTYNTYDMPELRAIMGHSMGGYGAMKIALKHPDIFSAVGTHGGVVDLTASMERVIPLILDENDGAGPFDPEAGVWTEILYNMSGAFSPDMESEPYFVDLPIENDGAYIDETWQLWRQKDPTRIASELTTETQPEILLQCGTSDILWLPVNEAFHDSLGIIGLNSTFIEHIGDHNNALGQRFPVTLAFFDSLFSLQQTSVSEGKDSHLPSTLKINSVYPNPFNSEMTIIFTLPNSTELTVSVYNILGAELDQFKLSNLAAGRHNLNWNAEILSSGQYIIHLRTSEGLRDISRVSLIR